MTKTSKEISKASDTQLNKVAQSLIPDNLRDLADVYFQDDDAPAAAIYELTNLILEGPNYALDAWEPESVWLSLARHGWDLSSLNEQKILCISALKARLSEVMTSASAFKNIVLVLNNEIPNVKIEEDVDVEQIAWAVTFIQAYMKKEQLLMDYGPIQFVADNLHEEGFFLAPKPLKFAQERLTRKNNNTEMEAEVQAALDGKTEGLNEIVKAQLHKHQGLDNYIAVMYEDHAKALKSVYELKL